MGTGAQDAAGPAATLAERLAGARRRWFVGRESELELVRSALEEPDAPFAVLFVHGPGGVGKSALLRAAGDLARAAGARTAALDLRAIEPSPAGFGRALADELAIAPDAARAGRLGAGRCVLALDTYERAGALDAWLRERFLPAAPAGTLVLIAGREPPGAGWMTDPGWRELLRVVSLRNLPPEDGRALLRTAGVDAALAERLLALTHGHPLALALLIDLLGQSEGAPPAGLADAPDVVRALLERFVVDSPDALHRRALDVCARARATTEDLLRSALGADDAGELFAWLRGLSFVEEGPRGVFPHDLARDVLAADARWRDPEGSARLHARVHDHVVDRLAAPGVDRREVVADLIFLHRDNPFTARFWDWHVFGAAYADELRSGDRDPILRMTARHEGDAVAALVAHWLGRPAARFVVFRGDGDRPIGFVGMVALHEAAADEIAADPGAAAMWRFVQAHAPTRPGDEVHVMRFFVDEAVHQAVASPSLNLVTVVSTQEWLGRRQPAWDLIAWMQPDAVAGLMAYIDFERVPGADYTVGERRYGVYAHDWRRMGATEWLEVMGTRETAQGFDPAAAATSAPALALSQTDFGDAVRAALRDLRRPGALAASPLTRSRMVHDREDGEAAPAEVLEALLREAVAALAADPRDEKLARALDRTYLRPAATQERAAELLGLPFSTYRRHVARGTERVVAWLWQREVYGD